MKLKAALATQWIVSAVLMQYSTERKESMTMLCIALAYFCTAAMLFMIDQADIGVVLIMFGVMNIVLYRINQQR